MKQLLARLDKLERTLGTLARAAGVGTDPDVESIPEEFLDTLSLEVRRAMLQACSDWARAHEHDVLRDLSVRERLLYPVPFYELTFAGKDQVMAAWERWEAGERPLPCGLRELATSTPAATVRPSPNGQAEPERRPKLDLP